VSASTADRGSNAAPEHTGSPLRADVAASLAEAARVINAAQDLEDTLDAIVRATVASVPGFDHVGISILHRDGDVETKAATGQLVWELDDLQYRIGEGPCVSALHEEPVVTAPDITHEQRWPRYVPEAVRRTGLQAQMAVQLFANEKTLGGLNLYSTSSATIDPDAVHVAEVFATHAALALERARRESDLNDAIASRQEIGMAIGLTMARFRLDRDRAFQYLVRASSTSQIKLRDLAREVVETADAQFGSRDRPLSR
jgi:GAF domain-containing protein